MRKFLSFIVIGLASISLLVGCNGCKTATNPSGIITIGNITLDPTNTGYYVKIAAKLGAVATINAQPDSRQYFKLAATAINTAIANGVYDPATIQNSITKATGNELVSSSIADALGLYQSFLAQAVDAKLTNLSPYTVPVLSGLADGINDAVNLTAPRLGGKYKPVPATKR